MGCTGPKKETNKDLLLKWTSSPSSPPLIEGLQHFSVSLLGNLSYSMRKNQRIKFTAPNIKITR